MAQLILQLCGAAEGWQGWLLQGQEPLLRPSQVRHRGIALHDDQRAGLPGVPQGACIAPDPGICLLFICSNPSDVSQSGDWGHIPQIQVRDVGQCLKGRPGTWLQGQVSPNSSHHTASSPMWLVLPDWDGHTGFHSRRFNRLLHLQDNAATGQLGEAGGVIPSYQTIFRNTIVPFFVGKGSWREEGTCVKSLIGLASRKLHTSGLDSASPAWSQLLSAVQAFHPSPSVYQALLNVPACHKTHMTVLPRFSF